MKKIFIYSAIFLFLWGFNACADKAPDNNIIKAEIDKSELTTDDLLNYKVIINSMGKNISLPDFPEFDGFETVSQAHSSNISFSKGEVRRTTTYLFVLLPDKVGKITIGPASISIGNDIYATESFEIEVTQGKRAPEQEFKNQRRIPKKPYPPDIDSGASKPEITL